MSEEKPLATRKPVAKEVIKGKSFVEEIIWPDADKHFIACDFAFCDLSNAVFENITFEFCDFSEATFQGSTLLECEFLHCTGRGVSFKGALYIDSIIHCALFHEAVFSDGMGEVTISGYFHDCNWSDLGKGIDTREASRFVKQKKEMKK